MSLRKRLERGNRKTQHQCRAPQQRRGHGERLGLQQLRQQRQCVPERRVQGIIQCADGEQGFGPLTFNNNRNGGYAQLSYRPIHIDNDIIKKFEPVVRYDRLNQLHTPVGFDEQRWSFGLDYWVTPSAVLKIAYELDDKNGGARDQDALLMQVALGF